MKVNKNYQKLYTFIWFFEVNILSGCFSYEGFPPLLALVFYYICKQIKTCRL